MLNDIPAHKSLFQASLWGAPQAKTKKMLKTQNKVSLGDYVHENSEQH